MSSSSIGFPPGPSGHWLFGCLKEKWHDPAAFFSSNRDTFGDIAFFKLGPVRVYQLNSPALIREHFHTKSDACIRGRGFEKLRPPLGDGVFTAEGLNWSTARKCLQPHFSKRQIGAHEAALREVARETAESLPTDGMIDVRHRVAVASLKAVFKTVFQIPWEDGYAGINELTEIIKACAQHQIHSVVSRFQRLPTPINRKFWMSTHELRRLSEEIIRVGRRESLPGSVLAMLIEQCDTGAISAERLVDQVTTLAVTGHETVANTVSWGLELLALHPEEQERFVRAAALPDFSDSRVTLNNVVKEIIRLYPAAWIISHEAARTFRLGEWEIPSGALLFVVTYTLHRDPKLWNEPGRFKPDRFSEKEEGLRIQPYQYVPFGGGARYCLGSSLAELEIQILLEEIGKRFAIRAAGPERTPPEFSMTIRPKGPVMLGFEPRPQLFGFVTLQGV